MRTPSKTSLPEVPSILLILASLGLFIVVASGPLLGTLTAESALLLTAILAPLTFIAGATRGAHQDTRGFSSDFLREGAFVGTAAVCFIVLAWVNSWRFESCAVDTGLMPFAILCLPVLCLNLCTGLWLGRLIGRVKLAIFVAILAMILYLAAQISVWWMSPSLHFFNHYWVLIAGDLLEGQPLTPGATGYRLATFLFALTLYLLGVLAYRNIQHRRTLAASTPLTGIVIAALLTAISAVAIHIRTSALISPSRGAMKREYSAQKRLGPLVVHADPSVITPAQIDAILAEGTLWLDRVQTRSGIRSHGDIHIWLHSDGGRQSHFTGATHVHFALPSHREIHISGVMIPHPTLGHEIAHVLLGQVSGTFFGVPGVFGLIPNVGLSEGMAVMLTPELAVHDDLTIEQQTAAIYLLGFERDFGSLFELDFWSFWLKQSATAYVSAGAYLTALVEDKGRTAAERHAMIRTLAQTGDLYPVWENSRDQTNFNKRFTSTLKTLPLPEDAVPSARLRFSSTGFANEQCNSGHESTQKQIADAAGQGRFKQAKALAERLHSDKANAYAYIAQTAHRLGSTPDSIAFLKLALSDNEGSQDPRRNQWTELLGDYQYETNPSEAQQAYRSIELIKMARPAQREMVAKTTFMQSILLGSPTALLAQAGMRLVTLDPVEISPLSARYASLATHLSQTKLTESDSSSLAGKYLFAKGQINGGNYYTGLSVLAPLAQESRLAPEWQFEANRIVAHAYAMIGKWDKAIETLEFMRSVANRASEQLYISDFLQRYDRRLAGIP